MCSFEDFTNLLPAGLTPPWKPRSHQRRISSAQAASCLFLTVSFWGQSAHIQRAWEERKNWCLDSDQHSSLTSLRYSSSGPRRVPSIVRGFKLCRAAPPPLLRLMLVTLVNRRCLHWIKTLKLLLARSLRTFLGTECTCIARHESGSLLVASIDTHQSTSAFLCYHFSLQRS